MFIGEYTHAIDDKGRMAIPAKFRAALARGAVVTRGLDRSLVVYPVKQWKELAEKLAAMPISQSKSRAFSRLMLAGAMDVSLDKQGRVMLPEYLREYASVGKSVVITGLYDRLEVWDEKAWNTYKSATEKESNEIAEALGELGV